MRTGAAAGNLLVSDANGVMTWTDPVSLGIGAAFQEKQVIISALLQQNLKLVERLELLESEVRKVTIQSKPH